jgi:hypothetical protein
LATWDATLARCFGAGHPDRKRQADFGAHLLSDSPGDGGGWTEEVHGASHIEKRLIYGDPFHERSEIVQDVHDPGAEALVLVEVARDKPQGRAQASGHPAGHATPDAEGPRLVGRGQHHAAPDGDGLSPQPGIQQLFDRRVEGIQVGVKDRGTAVRPHPPVC